MRIHFGNHWQKALSSWKSGIIYSTSFLRKLRRNNSIVTELSQINLLLPCWYLSSISVLIFLSPYSVFQRTMEQETKGTKLQALQIGTTGQNRSPRRGVAWSTAPAATELWESWWFFLGITHITISSRQKSGSLVLKRLNVSCWKSQQNKPSIFTGTNRQGSNVHSLILRIVRKYSTCRPNLCQYKCKQAGD